LAKSQAFIKFDILSPTVKPDVSLQLDLQDLSAAYLGAMDGPVDLKANVKAQGQSVAQLIGSLVGTAYLSANKITYSGLDAAQLLKRFGEGWRASSDTSPQIANIKIEGTLRDGIMALANSSIGTTGFTLTPSGDIDLLRRTFNLLLKPKGEGAIAQMALRGLWISPRFEDEAVLPPLATGKGDAPVLPPAQ
jgi:hypothetical protein